MPSSKHPPKPSSSAASASESDASTTFDDSFVVRRTQPLPAGEEDSRGSRGGAAHHPPDKHRSGKHWPRSSHREAGREESDNGDAEDNDDAASLAELTTSYGSGVDLHPHHKRRGKPEEYGRRSSTEASDGDYDQRRHRSSHRESERSSRRRHRHREELDDEEGSLLSDSSRPHHKSSSRPSRYSRSARRHDNSPTNRFANIPGLAAIIGFFDGVNLKTVLLCMLGMTMILKLNRPPPPPNDHHGMNHGMADPPSYSEGIVGSEMNDVSPGVRGAVVNVNDVDGDEVMGGDDEEAAMAEEGGQDGSDGEADEGEAAASEGAQGSEQPLYAKAVGGGADGSNVQPPPPPPWGEQQQPMQGQPMQGQQPVQQQVGAVNQATLQQFAPQQQLQPMQQGYTAQQPNQQVQMTQQGYYAAPPQQQQQQQPLQAQADGMAQQGMVQSAPQQSGAYAVGQTSTYDQSPLAWQQAQMAQQQAQAQAGGVQSVQGGVQSQQFGSAVDASQMAPPPSVGGSAPLTSTGEGQQAVDGQTSTADGSTAEGAATSNAIITPVPLVPPPSPSSVLSELSNFKDAWDPYDASSTPMFWHIPKAGGSSIKDAMGGCHRFVQATEFGVTDGHIEDTEVAVVYPAVPGVADTDRSPFVNIDSTTVEGIQRAKKMGFADAQLAQVVVSPFVFETNDLFTPTAKGRLFSVFRHPIERAVSMFYYIRVADWEPSYKPELKDWTLEQYAQSDIVENNWMTRQLSNQLGGELTEENLKKAMEVVQTKFLVGLMSKIEPSMVRFEKYFRWTYHVNPPNQENCRERLMSGGANSNKKNKKPLAEGDPAWDLLAQQNNFDLPLYAYIEKLFEEQEAFVVGMSDDFRNVDATCCKCDPPTFPPEGFTCPQAVKNEG